MSSRWSEASAFRADPAAVPPARPSRRQAVALIAVLLMVAGAVAAVSYAVRPDRARSFDLLRGQVFLADQIAPVAVDLATGKPTLRLVGAEKQVGAANASALSVVPVQGGTVLLDRSTGEFNIVDATGFVIKHDGGGVPLPARTDRTTSIGISADQPGSAQSSLTYLARVGALSTDVYLVDQSVVQTAVRSATVKPRASAELPAPAETAAGGAVGANGDLWLLAGTGPSRQVHEYTLPADSEAGAQLRDVKHGSVESVAALASGVVSGSSGQAGAGATSVGVAQPGSITVYPPGAAARRQTYAVGALGAVDSVLPASNGQSRMSWLMHSDRGWWVVSVRADGSDLRGPSLVSQVPAAAHLAPPAASDDLLYTIDQSGGGLYRIGVDGAAGPVQGAARYPLARRNGRVVESNNFADAYVVARGPRVIVDSPAHVDAVVLFTDGSRKPYVIQKSSAVDVSAAGGAEALTRSEVPADGMKGTVPKTGGTKPKQVRVQPINNRIDCKTVNQKPHIPLITQSTPGSRSVALAWSYPLLYQSDCAPTTYVVNVTALSPDAPDPGGEVTVQGQDSTNLSGLYPSTRYSITVTAVLNKQATSSKSRQVVTSKEGPAAPTALRVTADASGDWQLRWTGCGSVQRGCVPVGSWKIVPSFCDGLGLSGAPATLSAPADSTAKSQPPAVYAGSDALLGRGLRFQVQGTGLDGEAGTPSAASGCVYSHSPPQAAALQLAASQPSNVTFGGTTTTTATLALGDDPVRAVGGVGASVTFTLTGDGVSQTRGPFQFTGQSTIAANFGDVRAGARYTASATVSSNHGGGTVTVRANEVTTRADWPASLALTPTCEPGAALTCELSVAVTGVSSADAHDEQFDVAGTLQCGSVGRDFQRTGLTLPATIDIGALSQLDQFFGACTLSGSVGETAGTASPQVFGGVVKTLTAPLDLGPPSVLSAASGDFAVQWDSGGGTNAQVTYTGSNPLFAVLTTNYTGSIVAPNGESDCGNGVSSSGATLHLYVSQACVDSLGGLSGQWTVRWSYHDATTQDEHDFSSSLDNPPPGYQPCDPTGFVAEWQTPASDGVQVSYTGDVGQLGGCSHFDYQVFSDQDNNTPCAEVDDVDPRQPVVVQCSSPAPADGWTVHITWHNDDTGNDDQIPSDIPLGPPPQ
ncbi:hypothetical protein [uncultured Jatrophihabitans sp.]|uniref:hypothetical protein n=1 Tax=uncultured Jatrophihabitans sp. TaxID=1610747 RepID=UPI0035CB9F19